MRASGVSYIVYILIAIPIFSLNSEIVLIIVKILKFLATHHYKDILR